MSLAEARAIVERSGAGWAEYIARPLDPDAVVLEVDATDGFERWAPVGFRLAGVLEHGTDHRSQVCTALTALGVAPPKIDVFDYGLAPGPDRRADARRVAHAGASITAFALARSRADVATLPGMRDLTNRALDTATALGATYADVRVIRRIEESINIKSTRVEGVQSGETEGFGVRVLVDGAWGFAASHHLSTAEADRVAAEAVRIAKASATALRSPVGARRAAAGPRPLRDARRGGPVRGPARSQGRRPAGGRPRR